MEGVTHGTGARTPAPSNPESDGVRRRGEWRNAILIVAAIAVGGWIAARLWVAELGRDAALAVRESVASASRAFSPLLVSEIGADGACRPILDAEAANIFLQRYARYAGLSSLQWFGEGAAGGPERTTDAIAAFEPLRQSSDRVCSCGLWALMEPSEFRSMAGRVRGWILFCSATLSALTIGTIGLRRWRERGFERRQAAFRHIETVAVGLGMLLLALTANIYLSFGDRRERDRLLADLRRQALLNIQEKTRGVELFLAAAASFFESSEEVNRAEFETFAGAFLRRVAVETVEWRPRFSVNEWPEFAREIGETMAPDDSIGVPPFQTDAGVVYPGLYTASREPEAASAKGALEADFESAPEALRRVLDEAWASGRALAAWPIADADGSGRHIWVLQPVSRPVDQNVWRWSAEGMVAVRVRWEELFGQATATASGVPLLNIKMEALWDDGVETAGPAAKTGGDAEPGLAVSARRPLHAFGRLWGLQLDPTSAFASHYPVRVHGIRHLAGLLTCLAITVSVGLARERGARLEREVRSRTVALRNRERELRLSEERYRQLFSRMPDGFALHEMLYDAEGRPCDYRFLEVNPAFERLTGLRAADLVGRTLLQALPRIERDWIRLFGEVVRTGEPLRIERRSEVLNRDFSIYAYRTAPAQFAVILEDIAQKKRMEEERRRMESKMMESQRLESLGLLAGGIAHDFNNYLMTILGNAELASHAMREADALTEHLAEIQTAARRAADLCRQMLAYAGRGHIEKGAVALNPLITEIAQLLKTALPVGAVLKLDLHPTAAALGDASQIRQVVMNLVINAAEALGDRGGEIRVSAYPLHCDAHDLEDALFAENLPAGDYVAVKVEDNGCGMDEATQKRIFDPFFTTKYEGRGLGLSAVMGIIRSHGGALKLRSRPGEGAQFIVILPSAGTRSPPSEASSASAAHSPWRGSGTILLADDEAPLRAVGARLLQHMGFAVLTAEDGPTAVRMYAERAAEIVCAVVDLSMPGMSGEEVLARLRDLNPDARVVIASGYDAEDLVARPSLRGAAGFIQKPFTSEELQRTLRRVLA